MSKLFGASAFENIFESSSRKLAMDAITLDNLPNMNGINESLSQEQYEICQPVYHLQKTIRQYFNKEGINKNTIANHPDFKHLNQTSEYINQYICSMFIDIKGSTTLSLKYDLEFVHQFKNAVIQACIECIRAFDGYVHRIMGDAVLGFFGSQNISKAQSILDCMNCVSILQLFLEQNIQPWLKEIKPDFQEDNDFGFRIGCNFGDDNDVLWANYGFGTTGEISPTGFSVDLAAKLQGLSSKNKAMLGEGLLKFINWPENFTKIKEVVENGTKTPTPYVTPNYTKNKIPINYLMRELQQDIYLEGLPIPTKIKKGLVNGIIHNNQIKLTNMLKVDDQDSIKFISNSMVVPVNSIIDFNVKIQNDSRLNFPLKVTFQKINHVGFGNNHQDLLDTLELKDSIVSTVNYCSSRTKFFPYHTASISRCCIYPGIHKMIIEVKDAADKIIFREIVYVPIAEV